MLLKVDKIFGIVFLRAHQSLHFFKQKSSLGQLKFHHWRFWYDWTCTIQLELWTAFGTKIIFLWRTNPSFRHFQTRLISNVAFNAFGMFKLVLAQKKFEQFLVPKIRCICLQVDEFIFVISYESFMTFSHTKVITVASSNLIISTFVMYS